MPAKVGVLGAGSWGTAMAALCASRAPTTLWARRPELARSIAEDNRNADYLPELALPPGLRATSDLAEAVAGAGVVVMAVPSHGFRAVLAEARPHLPPGAPVISLTKGVEQGTLARMTQIIAEVAPGHPYGVLTGPNLVGEIVAGHPTASVIAATDDDVACALQQLFSTGAFRVYTNPDVVGCELGGALKNVVAIAAGIADGMGFGDNTRAALITRGVAELTRLGVALGGRPLTFGGLTGMGDLVATCTSRRSRNRWVGEELAKGRPLAEITAGTRMVAEGVRTSDAVVELAARVGVEMPIADQVVAVLHGVTPASEVVAALMGRDMKSELHGLNGTPLSP
ncbi:MAG TPA: NAD(P)H-dependent glycerol-3-phosphate dehydrogenase [Acidimicrobiales bacterium]|nr:NAD(P)H-dependent glycerol-3-phosphate dehydrogenase [Acidimicrobiales bacterium]